MGGTLVPGGATFRTWAPRSARLSMCSATSTAGRATTTALLVRAGRRPVDRLLPGCDRRHDVQVLRRRRRRARATSAIPYARELTNELAEPRLHPARGQLLTRGRTGAGARRRSTISSSTSFTSARSSGPTARPATAKFLDVLDRIEYLADLGVNAIEPLPIVEYSTQRSLGYNGTDLFSPEMDYQVSGRARSMATCRASNRLLLQKGKAPSRRSVLGGADQPAEGVHRHLPRLWPRRDLRRRLQPRLRRSAKPRAGRNDLFLRPAAPRRRRTAASTSPIRIIPARCSRSGRRRCGSS